MSVCLLNATIANASGGTSENHDDSTVQEFSLHPSKADLDRILEGDLGSERCRVVRDQRQPISRLYLSGSLFRVYIGANAEKFAQKGLQTLVDAQVCTLTEPSESPN